MAVRKFGRVMLIGDYTGYANHFPSARKGEGSGV